VKTIREARSMPVQRYAFYEPIKVWDAALASAEAEGPGREIQNVGGQSGNGVKTKPSAKLVELVEKIQREVAQTNSAYEQNFVPGLATHPIPYFGKLEEAGVLTIGLNPSPGEFEPGRWRDRTLAPEELAWELHNYFHRIVQRHPWFDKWSAAFRQLNESLQYENGRVAHVDLSPRATKVASQVLNPDVFAEMIRHDLRWLPDLLECAKSAQLLLIAGAVNKRKYLIEFLAKHGQDYDVRVVRRDDSRRRAFGFYDMRFRSRCLPVCFSGSSPSARDRGAKLAQNISGHRDAILKLSPAWACTC